MKIINHIRSITPKRLNSIITTAWGLVFCFTGLFFLASPNMPLISLIFMGFPLGCFFMSLLKNKEINMQNSLIKTQNILINVQKDTIKQYHEIVEKIHNNLNKVKKKKKKK